MTAKEHQTSVVIPTIGRREQLSRCLAALKALSPPPDEIVIVDQSSGGIVRGLMEAESSHRLRVIEDAGRGAGRARNRGARAARGELLLFTDDDCCPHTDWVEAALELHRRHPAALLTGRVLAEAGIDSVPATRDDPLVHDYSGTLNWAALYPNNMVVRQASFVDFGGFDERFPGAGEDSDFCYRWLKSGRQLRYEPELTVVHLNWRTTQELERVWQFYGEGQGMFYAKHLREGDLNVLRFLVGNLRHLLRGRLAGIPPRNPDLPAISTILSSMVRSWKRFG